MTERKFVVLNTSIQTGSNANRLIRDDDGNVRAELELQLPDNIFSPSSGGLKLDSVSMLTTKFRTSMMETPLASLPIEDENTNDQAFISPCKLDVYPFSLTDEEKIEPFDDCPDGDKSFEHYKSHALFINFWSNINGERELIFTCEGFSNTFGNMIPLSNPFSLWFVKYNLFDKICNHIMNLAVPKTQSFVKIDGGQLYIKNIGTLEQILANALANAMTYALTEVETEINIDLLPSEFSEFAEPPPLYTDVVNFNGDEWVFWKYTTSSRIISMNNESGIHPKVTINEDSLSISYDTSAFGWVVPVLWNTSFIDNYDMPVQLSLDELLSSIGYQPPPKRYYKYGINITRTSYNFTILSQIRAAVFNIIANKAMKDTFSFLPWIKFPKRNYIKMSQMFEEIHQTKTEDRVNVGGRIRLNSLHAHDDFRMTGYLFNFVNKSSENVPALYQPYLQFFPDDNDYVLYYYELTDENVEDIPDNRINQLLYLGEFTADNYVASIRTPQIMAGNASPTILNNQTTTITEEFETETPSYPVGTTKISENWSSSTTTYGTTFTPSEMFIYAYADPYTGEPVELGPGQGVQFLQTSGTWQEGNMIFNSDTGYLESNSGINIVPMFGCKHLIELPYVVGDPTVRKLQLFARGSLNFTSNWRLFHVKEGVGLFEINPSEKLQTHTTEEVVVNVITPVISDDRELTIIPNIYDGDPESLYILDASSVTVDIGETEPVVAPPTFNIVRTTHETHTFTVDRKVVYSNSLNSDVATYTTYDNTTGVFPLTIANISPDSLIFNIHGDRIEDICHCLVRIVVCTDFEYYGPDHNSCIHIPNDKIVYDCWCISKFKRGSSVDKPITDYIIDEPPATKPDETLDPVITTESSHDASLQEGTTEGPTELVGEETSSGITGRVPYTRFDYYADGHFTFFGSSMTTGDVVRYDTNIIANPKYDPFFDLTTLIPAIRSDIFDYVTPLNCRPEIWPSEIGAFCPSFRVFTPPYSGTVIQFMPLDKPSRMYDARQFTGGGLRSYNNSVIPVTYDEILTKIYKQVTTTITRDEGLSGGNVRLTFTWHDLPIVVMSPIQSIVMTVSGIQMTQEIQPINMTEVGGASLVSTIPIIENYYSLAQTLRDLHDELVVTKDSFEDAAVYKLATTSGTERSLTFNVKYITKDGKLHQLYIPENGVFILQLTFGLSYYIA